MPTLYRAMSTPKHSTKKLAALVLAINEDKEIAKLLKKEKYATAESLAERMLDYVKAAREGRVICNIHSVSKSGMSRTMSFYEMAKLIHPQSDGRKYCLLNFWQLFRLLGYTPSRSGEGFSIGGCGMDMVFATNYNIIHRIHSLGGCTKEDCKDLAQRTPPTV